MPSRPPSKPPVLRPKQALDAEDAIGPPRGLLLAGRRLGSMACKLALHASAVALSQPKPAYASMTEVGVTRTIRSLQAAKSACSGGVASGVSRAIELILLFDFED